MLRNYLTIACRTLVRNKVYTLVNVLGLGIGLAAAMLILLYTKDEVSYDGFHANNPRLFRIAFRDFTPAGVLDYQSGVTGYFQGPTFKAGMPEIESFVRLKQSRNDMKRGTGVISQPVFFADPDFFTVLSFPLVSGDPRTVLRNPGSVVISEELALNQFGTTDALGKTIYFKDGFQGGSRFAPYLVTGVARPTPRNSSIQFDVLLPLVVQPEEMNNPLNWFNTHLNTFVLLHPGADVRAAETRMNLVYAACSKEAVRQATEKWGADEMNQKRVYGLQPFTDMHLSQELPAVNGLVNASNPVYSYLLSGIALFILLIACINFVNLTVARSLKRAKEIGIRKVIGGGRKQLIVQFLGESFLLSLVAFVGAVGLVELVLPTFNELSNKSLALSYLLDTRLVLGYVLLFGATGLLAGSYPAFVLSGYSPVQTLYCRFRLGGKNYLQKTLVVLQFAIASFLIIATLTVHSQFNYLLTKQLGYNDKHTISITRPDLSPGEARLLKEQLLTDPGIQRVAAKNNGRWNTAGRVNGTTEMSFVYEIVDPDYLPLLEIPVVRGRNFSPDLMTDSTQAVLVNEAFVKHAGWKEPLGQVVNLWFNQHKLFTVAGVVKDHHYAALNEKIGPQLFMLKNADNSYGRILVRIRPGTETASLQHIEKTFRKLFPAHPYAYTFLDEDNARSYEPEAQWKQIMLSGALLTIFVSCIGLFSLATYAAERRTKEIGIRKVLGASVPGIVQLLSWDFLKLVCLSFVFAFPAAWYATGQWLQNYPYRVAGGGWIFAVAALLAMLIALCTVSFQSVRVALTNPVRSLRNE
jgi:predicted permease